MRVLVSVLVVILCGVVYGIPWDVITPLDEYVQGDDGAYTFEVVDQHYYNSCTVYVVNMTSQKWIDESYVDRPYWYHWMGIAIPDEANLTHPDAGFLFINGGSNDYTDSPPGRDDGMNFAMCVAAMDIGVIGAYINQVPNQPLYFTNDVTNKRRSEDSLIAWTWREFIDTGMTNPQLIARMAMTKAAKRGLDTINQVAAQEVDYAPNVNRFLALGASKRGWTTWSLAATDQRVIAAAPLVFSMLKFNETLMSHFRTLGGAWSFAFSPYYNEGLTRELLNPETQNLFEVEDMWFYRERLTLPILQLVSTGDEFFLLQDSHHWWNDIPDPKWTYMLENAEHAMFPHYLKLYSTATTWFQSILEDIPIPTVTWDRGIAPTGDGFINFNVDIEPQNITVYRAVTLRNDTRRDFRLASGNDTIGINFHPVIWTEFRSNITKLGEGQYQAMTGPVDDEWVAFLVQAMWRGPNNERVFYTSETQVIPDTFPVDPCFDSDSCYGTLV